MLTGLPPALSDDPTAISRSTRDSIGLPRDRYRLTSRRLSRSVRKGGLELKEQTTGSNKPLLQQSAGSGSQGVERRLYGIPVWLTSQLAIDESQGTASDASSVYVYEAAESIVVRRSGIRVEVDRSRLFNTDQSEVRAISRFDLVVPNPKSIVRIKGVIPA